MSLHDTSTVPHDVRRCDVSELDRAEDRLSCLKAIFGTTIGVNEASFDWCPDGVPPSDQEILGWLWFLQPSLPANLESQASGQLAKLMAAYERDELDEWWQELLKANG